MSRLRAWREQQVRDALADAETAVRDWGFAMRPGELRKAQRHIDRLRARLARMEAR